MRIKSLPNKNAQLIQDSTFPI